MITLRESLMQLVQDAAAKDDITPDQYVTHVLSKHFQDKLDAQMPSTKEIILGNLKCLRSGATFTVLDVIDSLHKRNAKKRGDYGRMLSLMIARNQISAEFTGVMKDSYKVYRLR